ncbi:hypothetical protein [Agaribacter flavus]|uniref:Uncharacterized protein n=1 Tax=Agaribacter flavus TaxID=1902781 RepID=A0ABV7FSX6_9ALTE
MSIRAFIANKSKQLTYYVDAYWAHRIDYKELEHFLWDTLEEWTLYKDRVSEVYTHKERLFWHILFHLQHLDANTLSNDEEMKRELVTLMHYLHNNQLCPVEVIGIRP